VVFCKSSSFHIFPFPHFSHSPSSFRSSCPLRLLIMSSPQSINKKCLICIRSCMYLHVFVCICHKHVYVYLSYSGNRFHDLIVKYLLLKPSNLGVHGTGGPERSSWTSRTRWYKWHLRNQPINFVEFDGFINYQYGGFLK